MRLGAEVIYERMYEVHVSGHACQEELKMMLGLTKPKFFIPMHGEDVYKRQELDLEFGCGQSCGDRAGMSRVGECTAATQRTCRQGRYAYGGCAAGKAERPQMCIRDRATISFRWRKVAIFHPCLDDGCAEIPRILRNRERFHTLWTVDFMGTERHTIEDEKSHSHCCGDDSFLWI